MIYTQLRRIVIYEREVRELEWEGSKKIYSRELIMTLFKSWVVMRRDPKCLPSGRIQSQDN